jgi:serine/threonine protein phosphatase PrpC
VRSDATYLLATDGFWACRRPQDWIAQWPQLLGHPRSAADAIDSLFSRYHDAPPSGLHLDNLTAIALRFRDAEALESMDETALPHAQAMSF